MFYTKKNKVPLYIVACMTSLILSSSVCAEGENLKQEMQTFSVKTGATRVIYTPGSSGATLTVVNPQSYPMLVQSSVLKEDKKTTAPFIVTPPLFRLDGHQSNRLAILANGDLGPKNRESLNWLCLKGIPPEPDSAWVKDNQKKNAAQKDATLLTQLRITSCLKLFVRPSDLKGDPLTDANQLKWQKKGPELIIYNPTPFYMNLSSVNIGSLTLNNPGSVSPFSELNIKIPEYVEGPLTFQLITDFGGDSKEFKADLK